jgi:hypothetical protein
VNLRTADAFHRADECARASMYSQSVFGLLCPERTARQVAWPQRLAAATSKLDGTPPERRVTGLEIEYAAALTGSSAASAA